MNKRQVLFSLFYDLSQTRKRDVYFAQDKSAAAMRGPGGPLWLWTRGDVDKPRLFSFLDEVLTRFGAPPVEAVIAEPAQAALCIDYFTALLNRAYHTRVFIAYYLPVNIEYETGRLRPAAPSDAACLTEWIARFHTEAHALHSGATAAHAQNGRLYVLTDGVSDTPAAMGMLCGKTGALRRLNLIYTPPQLRGHGYGKAVTAALAKRACAEGGLPVLYAAEENIIANRLYRSLGFTEAGRLTEVTFETF